MLHSRFDPKRKYLSFDHWCGGWNNIRQTYEGAGVASMVTNRILILPPGGFCMLFSDFGNTSNVFDWWSLQDKEAFISQFECIDYKDVPYYQKFSGEKHFFEGIHSDNKVAIIELGHPTKDEMRAEEFNVEFLAYDKVTDKQDFEDFAQERFQVSLKYDQQFIHFPRNFYAQPIYNFYLPTQELRLEAMERVEKGSRFRKEYYDLAESLLPNDFDALHVRRGDFLHVHTPIINEQYDKLAEMIEGRVRKDRPLYIATDEKDKSVFEILEDEDYDLVFLDDLNKDLTDLEAIAMDMIIPTYAESFLGSKISTFTNYINIQRGYKGMPGTSDIGINYDYSNRKPYKKHPWETNQYLWEVILEDYWYGHKKTN
ncbi:MAG: O-fucosyltransferase family protein [Bdellovibrionales bacterium]